MIRHIGKISAEVSTRESRLRRKALDVLNIKRTLKKKCICHCMKQFRVKSVYELRDRYWSKSRQARSQYLINSVSSVDYERKSGHVYLESGVKVCRKGFLLVLRINKKSITAAKKQNHRGAVATRGRGPKNIAKNSVNAISWLETYAKFYGDRMPDSRLLMLPYKTEKYSVYLHYKTEVPGHVSRSTFYRIWRHNFPQMKIKEVNSFSKCTVCTSFEKKLEKTLLPSSLAEIMKCPQEHNQRQMLERKYYNSKREDARKCPTEYLSLIIDGMDQCSKENITIAKGKMQENVQLNTCP